MLFSAQIARNGFTGDVLGSKVVSEQTPPISALDAVVGPALLMAGLSHLMLRLMIIGLILNQFSATWVTCLAQGAAVLRPLWPDAASPGVSSGSSNLS